MKQWISKHSIGLSLIPVVLIMVMIFCFSAQTGEQSGAMSGQITRWVVSLFVWDFEELPPQKQDELCANVGFLIRKGAHFSEYALLGLFLMLHIHQIRKRTTVCTAWLWAWIVGTLYAASDELHQGFVAGRGPSITDVMIDSSGVITGAVLLIWALHLRSKKRVEKKLPQRAGKKRLFWKKS